MRHAGFVLAGGHSSRMGHDKAFLPYAGTTLVQHVAEVVRQAAGSVSLVGDPTRYGGLGYPVHADRISGRGPAGGISTALGITTAPWNLIVACDMPGVTVEALRALLDHTAAAAGQCVVPLGGDGEPEPLCAAYHVACLPALDRAIRENRLKMRDLLADLDPVFLSGLNAACFVNVNTPAQWAQVEENTR